MLHVVFLAVGGRDGVDLPYVEDGVADSDGHALELARCFRRLGCWLVLLSLFLVVSEVVVFTGLLLHAVGGRPTIARVRRPPVRGSFTWFLISCYSYCWPPHRRAGWRYTVHRVRSRLRVVVLPAWCGCRCIARPWHVARMYSRAGIYAIGEPLDSRPKVTSAPRRVPHGLAVPVSVTRSGRGSRQGAL